ncbi:unnamed protein product [Ceratitis capitata]|uniref:(Mediterranean fruit fly) hypothetical protein n=1 Tax=Ceratitis capitata TaxID=7213 RepID=A0A811V2N2_CERCA|nr:unnamed protein product [Ceratitis capitata]
MASSSSTEKLHACILPLCATPTTVTTTTTQAAQPATNKQPPAEVDIPSVVVTVHVEIVVVEKSIYSRKAQKCTNTHTRDVLLNLERTYY